MESCHLPHRYFLPIHPLPRSMPSLWTLLATLHDIRFPGIRSEQLMSARVKSRDLNLPPLRIYFCIRSIDIDSVRRLP